MCAMSPRLLRPRATGFNPKSLPGLKVWYDAANTGSMTFNGSTVSEMADLSGNGFTARQTTANNQPTYSATAANGRPRLAFDSTDSLISDATIADYFLNPTTGPVFTFIAACYSPLAADGGAISFGSDAQANGRVFCSTNFGFTPGSVILDTVNASGGRLLGSVTQPTAAPHIMTFFRHTSSMAWRVDGVALLSKSNASGNYSATTAKLQIGKCADGGAVINYFSEVLVYASALSAAQLATAERGLGRKWGISVA